MEPYIPPIPVDREPDPTAATTQQTHREVGHLREVITLALAGVSTRIDGIEAAYKLFRHDLTQFPSEVDKSIGHLRAQQEELIRGRMAVAEERFQAINRQFVDIKDSLATAFAAAESAISKSDSSISMRIEHGNEFRKTLADQAATFMTRSESLSKHTATGDKLNTLGESLNKLELASASMSVAAVRRDDLMPINNAIDALRNKLAENNGREAAATRTVTIGFSVATLLVSLIGVGAFSVWGGGSKTQSSPPEIVALDQARSKRIDDIVARLDSLSARLNAQLPPLRQSP